ncbi:MAG TPA: NosD domain-containing protein [Candidatus Bathyarchaeia archaeon]|nr:NosD domain-containing protein [Candidatus Bathyarchaeia archaeon]
MFVFAFTLQPACASAGETITINPNGSISSPVSANITTSNNVTYTFTGNNYLPIVVNRSNIVINGMGYTLQTSRRVPGFGAFSVSGINNVTIKNTTITNAYYGVILSSSSNDTLSNNNVATNDYDITLFDSSGDLLSSNNVTAAGGLGDVGIDLITSDNNVLSANKVSRNFDGIDLWNSSGNTLSDNDVTANSDTGIWLDLSSGNVLSGNMIANNTYNFGVSGNTLSDFMNHIGTSNTVNGAQVYYLTNQSNMVINSEVYPKIGYLALVNCNNFTVQGLTLTHNDNGLLLASTNSSRITDNNITANGGGIMLDFNSDSNALTNNNITANAYGIYLYNSSGNVLSGNNVTANNYGIWLESSYNNTLSKNTVKADTLGGITLLASSNNNTLSSNNVTANGDNGGIVFESSDRNTMSNNVVAANDIGIELAYSSNNVLSGNMIANDTYNNFGVYGVSLADFVNNVDTSNLVNGKPLYYFMNESNVVISPETSPEGAGYVGLVNCKNVTVQGLTLTKNLQGLLLANTTDSRITDNNFTADYDGVDLYFSSGDVLSGNNVTANTYYGINLESFSDNNTLTDNNITADYDGVDLYNSSGNVLSGNNVARNTDGIDLSISSGDVLSGNNITNSGDGVYLYSSSNCRIVCNNMTNNYTGVDLESSSECMIDGNLFVGCGLFVTSSHENIVLNNTVNGKPLVYLESVSNQTVAQAGQVVLVNCRRIRVQNLNLSHVTIGLELWNTSDTLTSRNNMTNDQWGVYLWSSSNNTISRNNIRANTLYGVLLDSSSNNNTISDNNITANTEGGVLLDSSSNNNTISGNNITNNGDGVYLSDSSNNTISGNNISNPGYGVYLYSSSGNRIFHNNFLNNGRQADAYNSINTWDDGYPSGGNFWSNYRAVYPSAVENDSSATWNTPYVIDAQNTDRYPLMGPFHTFNVGTWNGTAYSVDTVSNSTLSNFSFNSTAKTLTFDVTGTNGTVGFCRVAMPLSLMSCANLKDWIVTVNGTQLLPPDLNVTTDANYTYIYFTYHHSTETVQITSTSAVPEFQPIMLLPLFMIITLLAAICIKKKRSVFSVKSFNESALYCDVHL